MTMIIIYDRQLYNKRNIMVEKFKDFLVLSNMAENTITAYIYAVNDFKSQYKELTKANLVHY